MHICEESTKWLHGNLQKEPTPFWVVVRLFWLFGEYVVFVYKLHNGDNISYLIFQMMKMQKWISVLLENNEIILT